MKALVAYFSASGVTEKLAQRLAKAIGADIYEIAPKVRYTQADLNWQDSKARSTVEMKDPASRVELAGTKDVSGYDIVFVGFPIWWYTAPHIIESFLESVDLSGKTVVPFATSGGSGMGNISKDLQNSTKAKVVEGKRFPASASEADLKAWAEGFLN